MVPVTFRTSEVIIWALRTGSTPCGREPRGARRVGGLCASQRGAEPTPLHRVVEYGWKQRPNASGHHVSDLRDPPLAIASTLSPRLWRRPARAVSPSAERCSTFWRAICAINWPLPCVCCGGNADQPQPPLCPLLPPRCWRPPRQSTSSIVRWRTPTAQRASCPWSRLPVVSGSRTARAIRLEPTAPDDLGQAWLQSADRGSSCAAPRPLAGCGTMTTRTPRAVGGSAAGARPPGAALAPSAASSSAPRRAR